MSANKKNNINTDRPIIQSSGYNGSEESMKKSL